MSWIQKIRNLLLLGDLPRGLGTEEARAVRVTNWIQIIFLTITTLLWPQVLLNEPPETLKVSSLLYVEIILFMVIGRIFLYARRFHVSSIITLAGVFLHLGGLCVAYADDPAHYGYFLLMLLPFLLIPSRYFWTRWAFVVIAGVGFLADQVYFRIMSGEALFGPPKSVLPADYLMPPMIMVVIFYALLINSFVKAVTTAETALAKEHAASERLLLNILPEEIAAELKVKGASDPRYFEATTICFTDFAGFTQIAESMTPTDLVAELDKCFSYFDSVIGRNGLEKLKTIGDSYMFAGGVPVPSPTHAIDSVMAALEIQALMNQMKEIKSQQGLPYWELRLGIHSGDLVAGVIGERKFAYDVWSDTVNTASRCESSGVSGKINISKATYELVKDFFQCEYRGPIPAKNKGTIDMYFVNGILPGLSRENEPRVPNQAFRDLYQRKVEEGGKAAGKAAAG